MKLFFLCVLALALGACASSTPQTDSVLSRSREVPEAAQVPGVPFIEQSDFYCGPSTLAMTLQWAGKTVRVDELAEQVYTPGAKGSFQADMISASRRQGMTAIPVVGLDSLLKEVAAGHPVIVFENLGLSWAPTWHYAVVFGYDLPGRKVILHSGPEASKVWDLKKFERSWKLGDYWGMVILPPGRLAASADERAHEKAAAALEQIGKYPEAELAYLAIQKKWPASLASSIGLANIAFGQKQYSKAVRFLQKATQDHPAVAMAWHNLAIAYGAANKSKEARQSAMQALQLANPDQRPAFQNNLKNWIE